MGIQNPKNSNSPSLLNGMVDFALHVVKPFHSLAGKQLSKGGEGSGDLMKLCNDTVKSLNKIKGK